MPLKRLVTELGFGTDLRGRDYTKAAVRALGDALRRNSLTVAPALGYPREAMHVAIEIGVADPAAVDADVVAAALPYGEPSVRVVAGGLDVPADDGDGCLVIAVAAAVVWMDVDGPENESEAEGAAMEGDRIGAVVDGGLTSGGSMASGGSHGQGQSIDTTSNTLSTNASGTAPETRRLIVETGIGVDLRGADRTKAARRAVHEALHRSSIALFGTLGIPYETMRVELRIGVGEPDSVDVDALAAEVPHGGGTTVNVMPGGLDVVDPVSGARIVVACAAVIARLHGLPAGRFRLADR